MVIKLGNIYGFTGGNFAGNVYSAKGIAPALKTMQGGNRQPLIIEKTKKQIPIDGTINKVGGCLMHLILTVKQEGQRAGRRHNLPCNHSKQHGDIQNRGE